MLSLIQSKWFTPLVGAIMFLLCFSMMTARDFSKIAAQRTAAAAATQQHPAAPTASWVFVNPELDKLIDELKNERAMLSGRERQLGELEARLRAERTELDQVVEKVKKMQEEFDKNVIRVAEEEAGNLKKNARTYAKMEPASAASILRELDDKAVVKVLLFMKEAEAAGILENMAKGGTAEAKRAAEITEKLRTASQKSKAEKK